MPEYENFSSYQKRKQTMKSKLYAVVTASAVMLLGVGPVQSASATETPASHSKAPAAPSARNDLKSRLVGAWEADGKIWTFTDTTVAISGGPGLGADETPYQMSANTVSFKINGTMPVSLVIESITDKAMTSTINKDKVVFKRVK